MSYSKRGAKKTIIYDYENGVIHTKGRESRAIITDKTNLNEYNQTSYKYSKYIPIPLLVSNPDDGFGGGFILNARTFGYDYENYKAAYIIKAFATTQGSGLLSLAVKKNIARTNFFLTTKLDYGNFFPFYSFYGVGNNTVLLDSLEDEGFYKARYTGLILNGGITYHFFNRSGISLNGVGEILSEGHSDQSFFDYFPSTGLKPKNAGGAELKVDIDFRDSKAFTTRGIRFILSHKSLMNNSKLFGKTNAEVSYYGTSKIGIPITLGIKAGTERTYGDNIPYYHLASIGQSNHLRGFLQNRFSGVGVNYVNTDLRFHLGKLKSGFLPMYYGINLFGDIGQIVRNNNFTEKKWHKGYGGGIYLTPINKEYVTLQFNLERSIEHSFLLRLA
ncbi:MAG: hypothetical protein JKX68_13925 [Flavobacteriales bacterium]|nr:hypothetical protein [Flavobacteriales bacterium]